MGTILIVGKLIFIVHTRDHGVPHVTVYSPSKTRWEARAKVAIKTRDVIESKGFTLNSIKLIKEITKEYELELLEEWYRGKT